MTKVIVGDESFDVDAEVIANGLGLAPSAIPAMMKVGRITSICERGEGTDAGRHRLTFLHDRRRLRLIVDRQGAIIKTICE